MEEEGDLNPLCVHFNMSDRGSGVGLSVVFREQCGPPPGKDIHRIGASWRKAGLPNVRKESGMKPETSGLREPLRCVWKSLVKSPW